MHMQPLTQSLLGLPTVAKYAVLAVAIYACSTLTRGVLRYHAEGYLQVVPTVAVVMAAAVSGYILGALLVALMSATAMSAALLLAASMRKTLKQIACSRANTRVIEARFNIKR
jgi:membrane associated rhomboid family serine protease